MKRTMLLAAMCAALILALGTAAFAQTSGPSGADGTYNCEDFTDQGQAQEFYNNDPGDTNGLDEDGDGTACETLPTAIPGDDGGTVLVPPEETPTTTQYAAPIPGSPECPNTRVTPDGLQCSDLPDVTFGETETTQYSTFEPCPLGLDQYPAGTACGEGGSYVLPSGLPAQGTLSEGGSQVAPPAPATTALPATGGPPLALLAGALLVGAGLVLRRR